MTNPKALLPLWAIFAAGFVLNLPYFSVYPIGVHDEAVVSLGADRLLAGEIPYRDWDSRFPPGAYLLTAASFLLFGVNLIGLRVVMLFTGALLGTFVYLIARRLLPEKWALLCWFFVLVGVVSQITIVSYHLIAICCLLAGVLALGAWAETEQPTPLVWAGVSLAGACFTLQTEAATLLVASLVTLYLYRQKLSKKGLTFWLAGWLGSSLVLWSWVLWLSSAQAVWRDNVQNALGLTRVFNSSPYDLAHIGSRWSGFFAQLSSAEPSLPVSVWALQTMSYLLVWSVDYVLFFPVLLGSVLLAYKRRARLEPTLVVTLLSLLLFTFISRHRLDMLYLKYLTPLWFILMVWLLYHAVPRAKELATGLFVLYLTCFGFQLKDAGNLRYPIHTARGTLYTDSPQQAAMLNLDFQVLNKELSPGSETLLYPYACGYYFWGGLRNVIRPPVLVPMLYSQKQFQSARELIEMKRPKVMFHFPLSEAVFGDYPGLEPGEFLKRYEESLEFLFQGYVEDTKGPSFTVYRRVDTLKETRR